MALYTDGRVCDYARDVAKPKVGTGPWGQAIRYWLNRRNELPADLVRNANRLKVGLTPNTVSRARRGFHVSTRVLEKISMALEVTIEEVLVSPDHREDEARLSQLIQEGVQRSLRQFKLRPEGGKLFATTGNNPPNHTETIVRGIEEEEADVKHGATRIRPVSDKRRHAKPHTKKKGRSGG